MYRICTSIVIDFAHHVAGHDGPCLAIHGHTWRFELELEAAELDKQGFVVDFSTVKRSVFEPCHRLLDHGYAMSRDFCSPDIVAAMRQIGAKLMQARHDLHGTIEGRGRWLFQRELDGEAPGGMPAPNLGGAWDADGHGLKLVLFPFDPTSERLAAWLYRVAAERLNDGRVRVSCARVYETLHPVAAWAEYRAPLRPS